MKALPDPNLGEPRGLEVARALQRASEEVLPFAMICLRDGMRAESITLETLILALENGWISFEVATEREFSHAEFREDILRLVWERARAELDAGRATSNLIYNEEKMPFYRLDLEERAALHLRMKLRFSYEEMGRILGVTAMEAEERVIEARTRILGRALAIDAEETNVPSNA